MSTQIFPLHGRRRIFEPVEGADMSETGCLSLEEWERAHRTWKPRAVTDANSPTGAAYYATVTSCTSMVRARRTDRGAYVLDYKSTDDTERHLDLAWRFGDTGA